MNELTYYTEIAEELQKNNPTAYEELDEEIHIIIHKLKFIPQESRPIVQVIRNEGIQQDYLNELLKVAGAQNSGSTVPLQDVEILIFIDESYSYLSTLPVELSSVYADSKAVKNNHIYVIQKPDFAKDKSAYIQDIEVLAEIIQSKYFVFGHEGEEWIKFDFSL
ncbi:hypothetical protein GQF61_00370 [Sphingobacterium sp. DK4209]|uniref:ABC transporter substrate-binding protein n=1 Tax=Sphingobacterium zhuxiongii TaxID=2662364 RepID=A0A5Q0QDN4_9SPHI|nr:MULTISPECIES: hypothetical protein [unclassified Sphingobacterium]MVZ64293.1 hypothetical protein [Sphingobacterium sp. DK4209]QGA25642.1 hypothetical protein GFH32_04595 [Sphingobacterium sp. dk4302]